MAISFSTPRGGFENQVHFAIFETQSDCVDGSKITGTIFMMDGNPHLFFSDF